MNASASTALLAAYYSVMGILALYGFHRLVLLRRYAAARRRGPAPTPRPADWPTVTVQLPIYNELHVAARLVDAVCSMEYPRERLEVQVLDDSDDETTPRVAARVAHWKARGVDIVHVRRSDRTGFKAGALDAGLRLSRADIVAVFDADFVPPSDFLLRAVPWFADPGVGMVQARWDHLNRRSSLLTRVQAILLDGHFRVEQAARSASGLFFNFNGTAGLWRRRAIEDAGGWQHDTLTEDLDLSYRAQLAGWRFHYLADVGAPAELPVDINAFKAQQFRWAKGSVQTLRKLLWRILRSDLPFRIRLEALVHLTSNFNYVLMVALSILVFPAMLLRSNDDPRLLLAIDTPLLLGATLSVLAYYVVSQLDGTAEGRTGGWKRLRDLPALLGVGIGLCINNAAAVLQGLRKDVGVFERTPKYAVEERRRAPIRSRYRTRRSLAFLLEGAFAVYFAVSLVIAVHLRMWASMPFLLLFFHGYAYLFCLTLASGRPGVTEKAPLQLPEAA